MDPPAEPDLAESTAHRVRGVLAIPAFRRLWGVTAITAIAEWQSLLALSALATHLTSGYRAQSFALGGVVATKLLPAMLLGPLAGALADKLDRRHVMVVCDVRRAGLAVRGDLPHRAVRAVLDPGQGRLHSQPAAPSRSGGDRQPALTDHDVWAGGAGRLRGVQRAFQDRSGNPRCGRAGIPSVEYQRCRLRILRAHGGNPDSANLRRGGDSAGGPARPVRD